MANEGKSGPRIYTRTGDDGTTGLRDGRRIRKDALRVAALGDLDELNSALGIILAEDLEDRIRLALLDIQKDLFVLGAELAVPEGRDFAELRVSWAEHVIDEIHADLPPLKAFILPGGSRTSAACHHARTVCRRAERALVALDAVDGVNEAALRYVNRLSDLLFVAARLSARRDGRPEVQWLP